MTDAAVRSAEESRAQTRPPVIDCDVHNVVPGTEALFPYLSQHWRETVTQTLFKGAPDPAYPKNAPTTARPEAKLADGRPAGSDLNTLRAQVLDPLNVEVGILTCAYAIDTLRNPDAAVAFATAVNEWQVAEWLDREPRLRASIVVPSQLPQQAAEEIDRAARDKRFVQVLLPARSHLPYGNRIWHPLWEAIARNDLVAGIHFGGAPGNPPTPSGWPSYYVEEVVDMATVAASQVTSIIGEGVFDQFPNARVAFLECGWTWLPAHMWRFDKEWRNLRRLVPWVRHSPAEYMRQHVRLSVLPVDAPPDPRHLVQLVEHLGSEEMLLYASDYPHLHRHDPERDLLAHLPDGVAEKIRRGNARAFYRL